MSDGLKLLAALVEGGGVESLRELREELFIGDETETFTFISRHYRRYGSLPAADTVEREVGTRLPRIREPFDYYLKKVQDRRMFNLVREPFGRLRDAMRDGDIDGTRAIISELQLVNREARSITTLQDIRAAGLSVMQRYLEVQANPGLSGIPSGWGHIDNVTCGYQNGDLVAWVARPEMGKSYLLVKQALAAWEAGFSVLFVTMEMTIDQIARRFYAMHTGINPNYIKQGNLSTYAQRRMGRQIETLLHADRFNLYAGSFDKRVDEVELVIQEFRPDIVFIDGAYLMKPGTAKRTNSRGDKVAEVFDELKTLTLTHDRPVIATTQFGRSAGKRGKEGSLETIGYTDTVGTHSSLVFSIQSGKPPNTYSQRVIKIMKGREGEFGEFGINYKFTPMDFGEAPADTVAGVDGSNLDWMST